MLRKEQFAFGAALVASALAVILSKSLAWFIFFIGLGFVFDFYVRDLIWGTDRLTREQIEKMPAEEYKTRVLGNPKTEGWVNWLSSGRHAFKEQMRKLAREAVIFLLVAPVLTFAGDFAILFHDSHKQPALSAAKDPYAEVGGWEAIPCKEGDQYSEQGHVVWECHNSVRTVPVIFDGVDLTGGLVPKKTSRPKPVSELLEMALPVGLFGFPAGLGFWILWRAILFAVKG